MKPIGSLPIIIKIETLIAKIIEVTIGILLALMVIIVFSNVISRYFFNFSLAWSEEISRFMLIWLAFLGAVLAYIKNEHLGLDILLTLLPDRGVIILKTIVHGIVLFTIIILLKGGIALTANTLASGWTSPATETLYGLVYSITPICYGLMIYFCLIKLLDSIAMLFTVNKKGDPRC